jgi:Protein of unknown function (DUF616).
MISIDFLKQWKQKGKKIAIFCAGQNGFSFYKILNLLHLGVDCFVDNDKRKWGTFIDGIVECKNPKALSQKENYITFICIGPYLYWDIRRQAIGLGIVHLESINDIIDDMIRNHHNIYAKLLKELPYGKVSELFYQAKENRKAQKYGNYIDGLEGSRGKIAVYTSIFGGYDEIWEPQFLAENIDYYFVSDARPSCLKTYRWIDARTALPTEIECPVKRNRYVKMHPQVLFPEYDYSIYLDGNIEVIGDISTFINRNHSGISLFIHPLRNCIFYEALALANYQKVSGGDICMQMMDYLKEGMQPLYGLPEMGVIVREHHKEQCIKLMDDWWEEFNRRPQRDQLSFMYVMWKNGMGMSDLTLLGVDWRESEVIKLHSHNRDMKR